ncbi:MAG TPA: hypothetical protein ENG00_00280, partial [Candidatus Aenigmarchaeota archaeon]|nr:hypothetical protein [Candidatus Aenigmarchaeota archaeon]
SDVTIFWDGEVRMREKSHTIGMSEFLNILTKNPEAVVIGTGIHGILKVTPEVSQAAEDKGIKIFADKSENAIDIFNGLVKDGKKAVAVIHTTC